MSDLISRQAAIDAMAELQGRATTMGELKGISKAWNRITELPSAEPKRRKGKWIHRWSGCGSVWLEQRCSECGLTLEEEPIDYNYCPHCGAKMDKPQESEDKE